MTAPNVERRLRLFCRMLAIVTSIGAVIELLLVEHTGSLLQFLPFGLALLVVGSVAVVSVRTTRRGLTLHRVLMVVVLGGGAFGIYSHFDHNMTFAREIYPEAPAQEMWIAGVRGGNPVLAAGVLMIAAALGLAGVYGMSAASRGAE